MSLERLWAGWRHAYVTSVAAQAATGSEANGSVFTRILGSGLPDDETFILWRGDTCFAILNAFPYGSGHLLVMPYREVPDLASLTEEEAAELWWGVRAAVAAVTAAYRPDGVNIGANLGQAAGAGVPSHVHIHCLPRWSGDTNFMTSIGETRVMPESLPASWEKLRAAWPT